MANRPSLYQRQIRAARPTMPRTGPTGTPQLGFTIANLPPAPGRRGPTLAKDTSRFTRKGQKKRHILPPPACARWDQDENGEWYCSEYFRAQQDQTPSGQRKWYPGRVLQPDDPGFTWPTLPAVIVGWGDPDPTRGMLYQHGEDAVEVAVHQAQQPGSAGWPHTIQVSRPGAMAGVGSRRGPTLAKATSRFTRKGSGPAKPRGTLVCGRCTAGFTHPVHGWICTDRDCWVKGLR